MTNIKEIEQLAITTIEASTSLDELQNAKVVFIGKNGQLTSLLKTVGTLPAEQRKTYGEEVNAAKLRIDYKISTIQQFLETSYLNEKLATETIDVTLPPVVKTLGTIHPVTQTTDEIVSIFASMGFNLVTGPEIEDDFHNFTALNFPADHPARSMHDTFFLESEDGKAPTLLRTHTSTVQIRTMMEQKPPLKIIVPGRVYRSDWDATHTPMFHQVEGLIIGKVGEIHMGHLKGCLADFLKAFFNIDDLPTRFRPHFFPFTEPSAEMDIGYARRDGKIVLGEKGGWMEILGCGMVHPNVLKNCGIDPEQYQGFAFGMGVERLAMLKYGIPDLRDMFDSDLRWLKHYGFSILEQPNRALGV